MRANSNRLGLSPEEAFENFKRIWNTLSTLHYLAFVLCFLRLLQVYMTVLLLLLLLLSPPLSFTHTRRSSPRCPVRRLKSTVARSMPYCEGLDEARMRSSSPHITDGVCMHCVRGTTE